MTNEYGVVTAADTVRLERRLPGPVERVWAYLTDPKLRATWLAGGEMELRVGGRVQLRFLHAELSAEKQPPERFRDMGEGHRLSGIVTVCEPPHRLAYTWGGQPGDSEVSFELQPQGKSVLLILTHRRLRDRASMLSVSPGWHAHLGILEDRLQDAEPRPFWTTYLRLEAEYERRIP